MLCAYPSKSIDASYHITCEQGLIYGVCTGQKTIFNNLKYGIESYDNNCEAAELQMPIVIKDAMFNCIGGILHSGVQGAKITNNQFDITSYSDGSNIQKVRAFGAYLDDCSGYKFEGNDLDSDLDQATGDDGSVGVIVRQNRDRVNEIYRNEFDNFLIGTEAIGWNRHEDLEDFSAVGLGILCNNYADPNHSAPRDNYVDILARIDETIVLSQEQEGLPDQGSISEPAGNLFGSYPSSGRWHFVNETRHLSAPLITNTFDYHHHDPTGNTRVFPYERFDINPIHSDLLLTSNYCADRTDLSPIVTSQEMTTLSDILTDKNLAKVAISSLIDGGNTESLLADVLGATSANIGNVLNLLGSYSPYLSEEVLVSVASSTAPFSHVMIRDILMSNPHSARSHEVMGALALRIDTLPPPKIDSIKAMSSVYMTIYTFSPNNIRAYPIQYYKEQSLMWLTNLMR